MIPHFDKSTTVYFSESLDNCLVIPHLVIRKVGSASITLAAIRKTGRTTFEAQQSIAARWGISRETWRRHMRKLEPDLVKVHPRNRRRTKEIELTAMARTGFNRKPFILLPDWACRQHLTFAELCIFGLAVARYEAIRRGIDQIWVENYGKEFDGCGGHEELHEVGRYRFSSKYIQTQLGLVVSTASRAKKSLRGKLCYDIAGEPDAVVPMASVNLVQNG